MLNTIVIPRLKSEPGKCLGTRPAIIWS